jgi:hypothetical protein
MPKVMEIRLVALYMKNAGGGTWPPHRELIYMNFVQAYLNPQENDLVHSNQHKNWNNSPNHLYFMVQQVG